MSTLKLFLKMDNLVTRNSKYPKYSSAIFEPTTEDLLPHNPLACSILPLLFSSQMVEVGAVKPYAKIFEGFFSFDSRTFCHQISVVDTIVVEG